MNATGSKRWLALGLVAVLAAPMLAGEIFVAPEGDDTLGKGTKDSPLKTPAAGLAKAAAGDTVTLLKGTYGPVSVGKTGVILQGAAGEAVRLQSPAKDGSPPAVVRVTGSRLTIRNLEIVGGAMHAVDFDQAKACTLEDCRCHDTGADVVKCSPGSSNITIRRCELYKSGQNGGWWNNAEGIDNVRSDNMLVQDCFIHDIATNGAYAKGGAKNSVFERCLFMRIGLSKDVQGQGVVLGESAGGTKDYENIDGVVRNCMFIDISGAGLAAWGALRPRFLNNTCINVARGDRAGFIILAAGSTNVPSKDVTFINNVVVLPANSNRAMVWIYQKGLEGKLVMDNNVYFGGGGKFLDWRSGQKEYKFQQWQKDAGLDANSAWTDPKLDEIHHLTADSPCVGKGQVLEDVMDDYDGGKRADKFDIGADQFDSGTPLKIPPPAGAVGTGAGATSRPAETPAAK